MGKATLVLVAIILGYLSPWLASPDDGQFLFLWFNWLPTLAAQWLSTSSAPLALTVHMLNLGTAATATAAVLFFWSRVAHAVIYTFGVPVLRTIAFVIGFGAQVTLFLRIVGAA